MSAETEESEIILQTETETSDINQNSIVTAAPAPLINSSSSAQIVRQPPPRPPPPQISSNRESKPDLIQDSNSDMTQDSNPDMMQDSNPDMMQDSNPGMMQDSNPGLMQDSNPGLMQDSNPGMMQDSNPGMTQDSNPGMMQDSNPGMTQNSNPGLMQDSNPGLMQDSNPGTMQDPGLMQDSNPGLMQDSNPDMMQDSNPDMMQDSNPGMMQDPGLMQDSNPGTMQDPGLMQDSNPGMTQNSNLGFTQDSNPDPNRAPSSNQSSESYRKRSGAHLWAAVSYSLSSFSEIRHKADPLFGDSSSQSRGGAEPQPLTDIVPVRPTLEQLRDCTQPPVVLVHGLFGFGPDEMLTPKGRVHYWETAIDRDTNFHGLLVLEASVGPISSYHDRACELFAQIVGCRVDYGEQHSLTHRHDRYGRDFSDKPLYPWWSEDRPLHFVGHSAGGNTIRQLQHLLQLDFWDRGTNASWVKSVTCIMAPMNGSTASYLAGCNVETGLFGLSNIVPLISMVDTLGAAFGFPVNERRRMLLWKLEHFNISQDDFSDFNRLRQRMSESGFLLGEDNLAYDLTLQSCEKFNALVPDFPNTYYLSYTASCSTYTQVKTFMAGPYLYMRNRKFSAMPPAGPGHVTGKLATV
ncbi:hypothetical protein BOX15_Mlig033366g1 [Macrostomum lignano]|uniref:Lipase-like C-terminal domain-containing protein n=1 Tax=Macrostomum lignano TaxID=282301 RepID=A0A267FN70_9PLAT|nr:hypothetical protein BOX15_Mlig033366g1 [Macrostomum lignano]